MGKRLLTVTLKYTATNKYVKIQCDNYAVKCSMRVRNDAFNKHTTQCLIKPHFVALASNAPFSKIHKKIKETASSSRVTTV